MAAFTKVALPLLLILVAGAYLQRHHAAEYFADALADANEDESVVIQGNEYRVENGRVFRGSNEIRGEARLPALQLAYEKVIAARSPILGLAGTDPASLANAASTLASSSAQLAALQSSPWARAAVGKSLYPLDFLQALAKLEAARQAFLKSGDERDAKTYMSSLTDTLQKYRSNINSFSRSFTTAVPKGAPAYATESRILTRADSLRAIATLQAAANTARSKARMRSLCVAGLTMLCDTRDLSITSHTIASTSESGVDVSLRTRSLLYSAGSIAARGSQAVELTSSDCVNADKAPIFLIDESGSPLERFFFLGDWRFVRTADQSDTTLYAAFAKHGIAYAPTQPTSYYECLEAASDWARVAGALSVAHFSKASPLSQFASGGAQAELRTLEKALASSTVREADAFRYVDLSNELPASSVPASDRARLAAVSLALRDRSAAFDAFVASIAAGEALNVERARSGMLRANDAATLFYTRSAFASLFLSQNPSIVSASLVFQPNDASRASQPFVWLSDLPRSMDPALSMSIARFRELSHP